MKKLGQSPARWQRRTHETHHDALNDYYNLACKAREVDAVQRHILCISNQLFGILFVEFFFQA
jgi:hypothetical protein